MDGLEMQLKKQCKAAVTTSKENDFSAGGNRVHICFISIIRETPWCAFMHVLSACRELAKRRSHRVTSAFKG